MATRSSVARCAALLMSIAGPLAAQQVFYVDDDATGTADGSSWNDAFPTLDDALSVVVSDDELRIAQGRYVGTDDSPKVPLGVTLRGGYGGVTSPWPDARSPQGQPTILDADVNGDDGPDFTNREDNADLPLRLESVNPINELTFILDGLVLRGGTTAGLLCTSENIVIVDCLVTDNSGYGLSLIIGFGQQQLVERTEVRGNGRTGVTMNTFGVEGRGTIRDVVIAENGILGINSTGGLRAGNFSFDPDTEPGEPSILIQDTLVIDNVASVPVDFGIGSAYARGGGAYLSGRMHVSDCAFLGNRAEGRVALGGGAYVDADARVDIVNSRFDGNVANGADRATGGGLYLDGENGWVQGCEFTNNVVEGSLTGDACGGGVAAENTFDAFKGHFVSCTVVDNHAQFEGGGVFLVGPNGGSWNPQNCILWGNTDATGATETAQLSTDNPSQGFVEPKFSCIQFLQNPTWDIGNIGADPLLSGPDGPDGIPGTPDDGRRLLSGSPCIDAGRNMIAPEDVVDLDGDGDLAEVAPFDRAGRVRLVDDPATVDTGETWPGLPDIIDMGAYEFGAPLAQGLWFDRGQALAGALGEPRLEGDGEQFAGTPFTLSATSLRPDATALLVLGFDELSAPFKGGVLVPSPDALALLPTSSLGTLDLAGNWPLFPSSEQTFWWQIWIVDADGPVGFAATNALSSTTP